MGKGGDYDGRSTSSRVFYGFCVVLILGIIAFGVSLNWMLQGPEIKPMWVKVACDAPQNDNALDRDTPSHWGTCRTRSLIDGIPLRVGVRASHSNILSCSARLSAHVFYATSGEELAVTPKPVTGPWVSVPAQGEAIVWADVPLFHSPGTGFDAAEIIDDLLISRNDDFVLVISARVTLKCLAEKTQSTTQYLVVPARAREGNEIWVNGDPNNKQSGGICWTQSPASPRSTEVCNFVSTPTPNGFAASISHDWR